MWPFRRAKQVEPPALRVDPAQGDPTAQALRAAAQRRDWHTIRDLLTAIEDPDDHAFSVMAVADVPGVQDWIGEWVDAEPRSTLPLLVRGSHAVFWAWEARTGARAENVSQDQFKEFWRRLRFAENNLDEVVERDAEDTTARTFLVISARGRQVDAAEADRRFADVVARHPHHRIAHEQMLQYRCRKWFGSHEQMFEFARETVAKAPAGSLLGNLIVAAHIERWLDLPSDESVGFLEDEAVRAEFNAAADLSVRHPAYRKRPGWPSAHNTFAMGFCLADDLPSAAEQFEVIGDQVTEWPWQYINSDDPVQQFTAWREDARAAVS